MAADLTVALVRRLKTTAEAYHSGAIDFALFDRLQKETWRKAESLHREKDVQKALRPEGK